MESVEVTVYVGCVSIDTLPICLPEVRFPKGKAELLGDSCCLKLKDLFCNAAIRRNYQRAK